MRWQGVEGREALQHQTRRPWQLEVSEFALVQLSQEMHRWAAWLELAGERVGCSSLYHTMGERHRTAYTPAPAGLVHVPDEPPLRSACV